MPARADPIKVGDEQVRAYELRREGRSYRHIAEALDCSVATAHDRVQGAIKARIPDAAEEERQLEVDRLNAMLATLEDRLLTTTEPEKIVPVMLKVSERRARLMGLDAPTKFTGSLRAELPDVSFARVVAEAQADAEADEEEIRDAG